jgi:glycosyltransferase involved in cell wall biosynthesis
MSARILVVGQLPPPVHGSNVMTERFLTALSNNGYQAEIVEKNFSKSMEDVGKASFRKVFKIPNLCRRLVVTVRERRPDLCVYFISVGLQSLLVDCLVLRLLKNRKIPYVLYFHGKGYQKYEAVRYLAIRGLVRSTLANACGGLVLGSRLKDDMRHCIPENRLLVLPNGIPDCEVKADKLVQENDSVVSIVFLANLIPTKGPMRFLKMAKLVREQEPRVYFTLAGRHTDDQYLLELKEFVAKEKLNDCIEIPGPLYGKDKEKLLQLMDIFVFPTNFSKESYPIVNIEAMQRGVPVISSPVGAIPEIVQDGVNGYIVDPENIQLLAERVLHLVRDKELRKSLGNAGRELFEQNCSLEAYTRNVRHTLEYFLGLATSD